MKSKSLLKTGLFSLIAVGSFSSFLYLNTVAKGDSTNQTLEYCEDQIMEKLDNLENKKSLPEAFILKKLVEMGKNLIP
jgi:hypothetical protein